MSARSVAPEETRRLAPAPPGRAGTSPATSAGSDLDRPDLAGLCAAYATGIDHAPGKALLAPAMAALEAAAGGTQQVAGYCARLAAGH